MVNLQGNGGKSDLKKWIDLTARYLNSYLLTLLTIEIFYTFALMFTKSSATFLLYVGNGKISPSEVKNLQS